MKHRGERLGMEGEKTTGMGSSPSSLLNPLSDTVFSRLLDLLNPVHISSQFDQI